MHSIEPRGGGDGGVETVGESAEGLRSGGP